MCYLRAAVCNTRVALCGRDHKHDCDCIALLDVHFERRLVEVREHKEVKKTGGGDGQLEETD